MRVYLIFGEFLILLRQKCYVIGQVFIVGDGHDFLKKLPSGHTDGDTSMSCPKESYCEQNVDIQLLLVNFRVLNIR